LRAAAQEVMERQLAQLNRLASDLLDVNRIANGKLRIEKARINLNKVLSAAVDANRPLIENQGRIFTATLPSSAVLVNGDFTRLIEVFANLLDNAAKFTPVGGLIRLSAERIETNVTISIKDTGVGILQDSLSTIFDPYTQVEPDAQTKGGLGIGLALVKHIVQLHGGTVRALSDGPNTGAEFIVQLPIVKE
jgi:signal transduction histidine kinase